jgi:2-(1,2-epoxy-1,2-dihydrophenyl)acetyl-CoA isomerase
MSHIHAEVRDGVGWLTMDRPERFNALDVAMARDLRQAGLRLARDPEARAVVLRGVSGVFCSGADLKYIRDGGDGELGYLVPAEASGYGRVFKQILEYLHATISEIRRSPKPWIAAVDGVAAAGGLGLALSCDLVVASERSAFQYAYFKTGLSGAESTTFFLPRLVGLRRAMDLALLDPRVPAAEAQRIGLVSAVYPDATFAGDVAALAERLAAGPTRAYALAKRSMSEAFGGDRLDVHLDRELEFLVESADSADFAEGLAAFFGKRPPQFGGR